MEVCVLTFDYPQPNTPSIINSFQKVRMLLNTRNTESYQSRSVKTFMTRKRAYFVNKLQRQSRAYRNEVQSFSIDLVALVTQEARWPESTISRERLNERYQRHTQRRDFCLKSMMMNQHQKQFDSRTYLCYRTMLDNSSTKHYLNRQSITRKLTHNLPSVSSDLHKRA